MNSSSPVWRKIQRENFTSLEDLCSFLQLDPSQKEELANLKSFPLNLPRRLAEKIQKKRIDDPILRQFVPFKINPSEDHRFVKDPVGDANARTAPKCLHKYSSRALLVTTGACAMHCRYCFRQNFEYAPLKAGFAEELGYLRKNPTLKEVILSGGDPLSLSNRDLWELLSSLSTISHLKRLRFHTRFPIGIPERIDAEFLSILGNISLQTWFVIHTNHPLELDAEVLIALKRIQKLGVPVLNQSVLLKGVNDSIDTLQELCEKLIDNGIVPYYIHQLDPVEGTNHFEVDPEIGKNLVAQLYTRLSGYGIPKYVQEIPKELSKTLIF